MNHRWTVTIVATLAALAALVAGCSRAPDATGPLSDGAGVLGYVPAETAYVFASVEPLPEAFAERMTPHLDAVLNAYAEVAREFAAASAESADAAAEAAAGPSALAGEVAALMDVDALRAAGLSRESQLAVYGVGLLPVLRIGLADVEAFEATLVRLEARAGGPMARATVQGLEYRYVGDTEGRLLLAVAEGYAVLAVVPTGLSDASLAAVLGVTPPARSIAASGRLEALATKYGYLPHGIGVLDIERVANVFIEPPAGVAAEVLALSEFDAAAVSDGCRRDVARLAGAVPRFVTGYTAISDSQMDSNSVMELRADLAAGLSALGAPVPGLGSDRGGLGAFGMSIDLMAAREFYAARLDALEAEPLECEYFADVEVEIARGQALLAQPVPPIAYSFHGMLVVIDEVTGLDPASGRPPESLDMQVLVATDNAVGLVQMGAMFSPEIAAMNLEPGGAPAPLVLPQLGDRYGPAYVAITDDALGLAIGENAADDLVDLLAALPPQPPLPLFSAHVDAGRYYQFVGDQAARTPPDPQAPAALSPAFQDATAQVNQSLAAVFDRMSFTVTPTQRGIEITNRITLEEEP